MWFYKAWFRPVSYCLFLCWYFFFAWFLHVVIKIRKIHIKPNFIFHFVIFKYVKFILRKESKIECFVGASCFSGVRRFQVFPLLTPFMEKSLKSESSWRWVRSTFGQTSERLYQLFHSGPWNLLIKDYLWMVPKTSLIFDSCKRLS